MLLLSFRLLFIWLINEGTYHTPCYASSTFMCISHQQRLLDYRGKHIIFQKTNKHALSWPEKYNVPYCHIHSTGSYVCTWWMYQYSTTTTCMVCVVVVGFVVKIRCDKVAIQIHSLAGFVVKIQCDKVAIQIHSLAVCIIMYYGGQLLTPLST